MKTPSELSFEENVARVTSNILQAKQMTSVLLEVAKDSLAFIDEHADRIDNEFGFPQGLPPVKKSCGYQAVFAIREQLRMFDQEKCPFCKEDSEVN